MLPEPVIVLGATGQLGVAICKNLEQGFIALSSKDIDLGDLDKISASVLSHRPGIIINAAAYTNVDDAENNESTAHLVNAESVKILALLAKSNNIPFIHFSTDYVFAGDMTNLWTENDPAKPLNVYGRSKLSGEEKIKEIGGKYLIFRTSWLFGEIGNNFVKTMLRTCQENEVVNVVDDQYGSPTYAQDLADAVLKIVIIAISKEQFPSGIYHICNQGVTSRLNLVQEIISIASEENFDLRVKSINPVKTSGFRSNAARPLNSCLDVSKVRNTFGIMLPSWESALNRCIKNLAK